jgi:P pilus assembly chaperone PapD
MFASLRPTTRWLLFALVVAWLLLILASALDAQVPPQIELRNGQVTTTIIRNPSQETLSVTVELRERHVAGSTVTTGREIQALVSPSLCTLAPGETQTVRIRLREAVASGTVLGLVTTFTPSMADAPAPGSDSAPVARLILQTRIVSKARVGT